MGGERLPAAYFDACVAVKLLRQDKVVKLLGEFDDKSIEGLEIEFDASLSNFQFLKIIGTGELNAEGDDRQIFFQTNNLTSGYNSWIRAGGQYGDGQSWTDGFYIGRSIGHVDATFAYEYSLSFMPGAQRITGLGSSTFAHANNQLAGHEAYGFIASQTPVKNLRLTASGGLLRHRFRIIVL